MRHWHKCREGGTADEDPLDIRKPGDLPVRIDETGRGVPGVGTLRHVPPAILATSPHDWDRR
jgi:hypothetical protein